MLGAVLQQGEASMRLTTTLFTLGTLALCTAATMAHAADPVGVRKISVVTQD
jgi:hypothetical protein